MTNAAFSITIVFVSHLIHYFVCNSIKLQDKFINKHGAIKGQTRLVFFKRILGFFLFACTAFYYLLYTKLPFSSIGIVFYNQLATLYFVLAIGGLLLILNYFTARKPSNLARLPLIRATSWPKSLVVKNALSILFFLLGYEVMFRGVLFFGCLSDCGIVTATVINTTFYSLVHVHKGLKSTIITIPFGITLCIVTSMTGTIWAAFLIHVIYVLSLELLSLRFHPEMKIS
jgi:membrane protease YdiL (CAAX protease family)